MNIIGLHGYTGTGKDTIAEYLTIKGWKRVAFADPVREMLYVINPIIGISDGNYARLQHIVDDIGWNAAKRIYPEIRELLQRLATEACRKTFGDRCFVEIAQDKIIKAKKSGAIGVVVTDVRHDIEGDMMLNVSLGTAMIFEVTRPGYEQINSHSSEFGLSQKYIADVIQNNSDVHQLFAETDKTLEAYGMA